MEVLASILLFFFWIPAQSQTSAPTACGTLESSYGPYDYRNERDKLTIVERFHFTMEVELLVRGKSGRLGSDLDYTLRTSPNHHRALNAMASYGERLKSPQVPFATYSVECYFVRATAFRPDDTTARMLYASFLKTQGRQGEAVRQVDIAATHAGDIAFTHYNLGLSYFDLGVFDKAQRHAMTALELGFPRRELKTKLEAAGHWIDAGHLAEPASSAPIASAPSR